MLEVFRESGFPAELERTREGIGVELTTQLSLEALEAFEERERIAAAAAMRHFLEPESVAVVGASRRDGLGGRARCSAASCAPASRARSIPSTRTGADRRRTAGLRLGVGAARGP